MERQKVHGGAVELPGEMTAGVEARARFVCDDSTQYTETEPSVMGAGQVSLHW